MSTSPSETFTVFMESTGPRIQQALIASFGPQLGQDAAAEAFAYGWENWDRVGAMDNPAGYLYRVGRSRGGRLARKAKFPPITRPSEGTPWIEPGLPRAIEGLSERQRVATVLVHAASWTLAEVAELLEVDRGTVNKHAERGLEKLRAALEVKVSA